MDFFRFFLILLVPGLIAAKIYCFIKPCRETNFISTALIFDLIVFIINITGLYFFKGIYTMNALSSSFECLSFTRRYGLLSILVGTILAVIFGLIYRIFFWWRRLIR